MDSMDMFAHMSIVVVIALVVAAIHVRAQKPALWFFTHCAAIAGKGRALLNTLHSVSIWVATRYAFHNPFFLAFSLRGLLIS